MKEALNLLATSARVDNETQSLKSMSLCINFDKSNLYWYFDNNNASYITQVNSLGVFAR
jgi:hypothetical protein